MKPERAFYEQDPLVVARELLGMVLVHRVDGAERAGRIVETEAYRGEEDLACHASAGRTRRNAPMYGPAGHAYVYFIYGMHEMFNVVTWPEGMPSAVLVRALEPVAGVSGTHGPGRLTRAMGIDRSCNGEDLRGDRLFILVGQRVGDDAVEQTPRIGVDYAGEWAALPWRFCVRGSAHVSRRAGTSVRGPS
ncbi:MAG: putative 3-methyladenine DNA glycosylase [Myxococcales bacterium]